MWRRNRQNCGPLFEGQGAVKWLTKQQQNNMPFASEDKIAYDYPDRAGLSQGLPRGRGKDSQSSFSANRRVMASGQCLRCVIAIQATAVLCNKAGVFTMPGYNYFYLISWVMLKASLIGIAVAVLLVNSKAAIAIDLYSQGYSGANCVEEYGGTSVITPSISYVTQWASNNATDKRIFICPVGSPPLVSIGSLVLAPTKGYWTATVVDGSSSGNIRCQLISCPLGLSTACYFGPFRETVGSGRQVLSTSEDTIGGYSNSMILRCEMPGRVGEKKSSILNYSFWAWE